MKGILSALLLSIFVAAPLAGCGGSGESHLTKAVFIHQGDEICQQAAARQIEIASHYTGEVVAGNFEAVTAVFVPPMERELRRLEALHPPQADEGTVQKILQAIESGVKDAKVDDLDLFVKETDPFAKANELARRYGLKACADSSHAVIKPQG